MSEATSSISASAMPAVVTAGVPMRRPLVVYGGRGSLGTVFSFSEMPARSSRFRAFLPDSSASNVRRSTSMRWLSVPPETKRKPCSASAWAKAAALRRTCCAYSANSGWAASWNATALAAITWSSGPPCKPGNTALSITSASAAVDRMQPPRGPRRVLWVVNVTMSAYGTGFGCTPPAMRPATWAASNMNRAPTSSAIWRNGWGSMMRGYAVAPATIIFGRSAKAMSRNWSKSMRSSLCVTP
jgi:hypothetical protein